jgi:hypothetical protein
MLTGRQKVMLRAFNANDVEVHEGEQITSFRGGQYILVEITRARSTGKTGKVRVRSVTGNYAGEAEYYDTVFDLRVVDI